MQNFNSFLNFFWKKHYLQEKTVKVDLQTSFWPIEQFSKTKQFLLGDDFLELNKKQNSALDFSIESVILNFNVGLNRSSIPMRM